MKLGELKELVDKMIEKHGEDVTVVKLDGSQRYYSQLKSLDVSWEDYNKWGTRESTNPNTWGTYDPKTAYKMIMIY